MTTYQIQIINHHLRAMQAYLLNIPVIGCDTLLIIPSRKIHTVSLSVWLSSNISIYEAVFDFGRFWHQLFRLFLFFPELFQSTIWNLFDRLVHFLGFWPIWSFLFTKYSIWFELVFKTKMFVQKYGDPCFSILYFCSLLVWFLLSDYILFRFL